MKNGRKKDYEKECWYLNGKFHREDGPAIIYKNGANYWYKNGLLHRDDGPAVTDVAGTMRWHKNGKLHREDGPAVIYKSGYEYWWLNGICHTNVKDFARDAEWTDERLANYLLSK